MEPETAQEQQLHESANLPTEPSQPEPQQKQYTIKHPTFRRFVNRYGKTKIGTMSKAVLDKSFDELLETEKQLIEDFKFSDQ